MTTLYSILGSGLVSIVGIIVMAVISRPKTSAETKRIAEETGDIIVVRLRRELALVSEQLDKVRERQEVVDDYLLYDQRWHRREELDKAGGPCELAEHTSFLEFERTRAQLKERGTTNGHPGP